MKTAGIVEYKNGKKASQKSSNDVLPELNPKTRVRIKLYFSGVSRLLSRSLLIIIISLSCVSLGFAEPIEGNADESQIKIAGLELPVCVG